MRKIIVVPIIHAESDLGESAENIRLKKEKVYGEKRLLQHNQVVELFWDKIEDFFQNIDPKNLIIYQDGIVTGNKTGQKIVSKLASKGSRNFQLLANLIAKGAEIRKTEDLALLQKEYSLTLKLIQEKLNGKKLINFILIWFQKRYLLKKRDKFIAHQINSTLKEDENGALFIGAFHNVASYLYPDIQVESVKPPQIVKAYFKALKQTRNDKRFNYLSQKLLDE